MNISNIRTRFYLAKFSFQLTNILLSLTIEFFTNHHKGGGRLYSKLSPLSFAEYRIYIYIYILCPNIYSKKYHPLFVSSCLSYYSLFYDNFYFHQTPHLNCVWIYICFYKCSYLYILLNYIIEIFKNIVDR